MALNSFNRIATVYDFLARIVFGSAIDRSSTAFLSHLPSNGRILILGGGTGRLLPALVNTRPQASIVFIDASSVMIDRARKRVDADVNVQFIHGTEDNIPDNRYDAVITPFYLDMFETNALNEVVQKISQKMQGSAQWLVADFQNYSWWHRTFLSGMYFFFRVTTDIGARHLPDYAGVLFTAGWQKKESKILYAGFIEASRWQREG